MKRKIVALLDGHRNMTIATLRADGWPQATTVGYANDGLTIYFLCGKGSQKDANLTRDPRCSLTVDDDEDQVMRITGVSMAARARRVTDEAEGAKAMQLMWSRYPAQTNLTLELPKPSDVAIYRLAPVVISVLDYAQGFGHTDLVTCDETELTTA